MSKPPPLATRISKAHPTSLTLAQIRELLEEVERVDALPDAQQYAPVGALLRQLRVPGVLQAESDIKDIDEINATYEEMGDRFRPGARGFRFLNIIRNTLEKLEEHAKMSGGNRKRRTRRTRRKGGRSLKNRRKH
jgi:hypothetical protein